VNLPEYKRALERAMETHADAIGKAHAVLREQVEEINVRFFTERDEDAPMQSVRIRD